ncbi:hypothetical protein A3D77_04620 [Candidatus Gottesmanbacteria bacterium RIFCSPHIGHO2_02_FULL_39_11]|uniref:Polysaccharide pyruvyl transferase domain-containing protein n=1 Tax=Candidatus Gottesmanbacteria bacterium RIFCSPHIGHO2_02_FULL_39_11 TaxID=1798382 RepID=A0A1F5ZJR6_9BACT|nr:MAG: hypothetical protein A3D77_04620 [Candidatus Gottesmanbacteria bacterium RIFCSPHIGHO2_02_FULL_39_11]
MKNKNQMTILIPNAASPLNAGDLMILKSMLTLIKKEYTLKNLKIHSFDPIQLSNKIKIPCYKSLSYYLGFEKKYHLLRIKRFFQFFLCILRLKLFKNVNQDANNPIDAIISDYKNADSIMLTGGGYFRSQKGMLQSLSLLLEILPLRLSIILKKKIIVYPISFGPFAYSWQENYVAHLLKKADVVMVRESISYKKLLGYRLENIVLTSDLALLSTPNFKTASESNEIGFTVRSWLDSEKQDEFNLSIASSILKFSKKHDVKVRPIVQVSASKYNENDAVVTYKICRMLKKEKVKVLSPRVVSDGSSPEKAYKNLSFLIGMRLHSVLIAATQGVVSCAIEYEHKTKGILSDLGMSKFIVSCEDANEHNLYPMLENAYKNRANTRKNMITSLNKIRTTQTKKILAIN